MHLNKDHKLKDKLILVVNIKFSRYQLGHCLTERVPYFTRSRFL